MLRAEERLVDLAASVADGAPVDWAAAESEAGAREQRIMRHLRLVSDVAELYRSLPEGGGAATEPDAEPPAGPKWGRLVLLDRVGEGVSSEVYRAWDPELQREVALKLLKVDGSGAEAARWRMLGEARRLARVRHPHVVVVFGADRRDDRVGLWMELVKGATLEETVRRNGPLGAREAALVGLDLCGALAAVHGAGLVHRDVKAQNVMRETGGRLVLMDFGTGEEANSGARLAGTPLYLAPEIFRRKPASVASDLYSLGVLLFYLVTGQFPVTASTFEELAHAHRRGDRRRLRDLRPDLPEFFVRVVERALSHDPALRYESAGGMEAALRQALDKAPAVVAPAVARPRPVWPWIAVAAVAVIAAVGLTLTLARRPASAPAAGVSAAPVTQIAVLPLADLSSGSAPLFLADALTDQLIATLGQVSALRVTSRTSILQFKDGKTPVREIARRLGVGSVLEGSINVAPTSTSGERGLVINTRLIAAGTDTPLWAKTFPLQIGQALVIDGEIARAVASAVRAAVSPRESERLEQGQTTNPEAAEAYFQGRYHLNQGGIDNFRRAQTAFERAIQLDPAFAVAYAGLARAHYNLGFAGAVSQPAARSSALAALSQAIALDESSAEARAGMADLKFYYDWDWPAAEAAYQRALELNPSFSRARTQLARLHSTQGRLPDAVAEARRAEELDPLSAEVSQTLGLMLYYSRNFDAALDQLRKAASLDRSFPRTDVALSRVHEARSEWPEAIAAAERALELSGDAQDPALLAHLARLDALSGNAAEARRRLANLKAMAADSKAFVAPQHLAYVHAALGEDDEALTLLERAVAERDPSVLWLSVDPRLDRYRTSPRFNDLLRRAGLSR
jgi:eukaryotic-like serine/threonine-protein kinase